jgi:hypothetical protein
MAKSSEFMTVAKDNNIIKRLSNAEHIISDDAKKAVATAMREAPTR